MERITPKGQDFPNFLFLQRDPLCWLVLRKSPQILKDLSFGCLAFKECIFDIVGL